MEDSGIESDSKIASQEKGHQTAPEEQGLREIERPSGRSAVPLQNESKPQSKSSQLQVKLQRQREAARRSVPNNDHSKRSLLSRNRLPVPFSKAQTSQPMASDTRPLVMIESDESEDEFALPKLSKQAQREITQQLIKDGYNLDMEPDDEDLDLIPPRPFNERCVCCQTPFVWDSRCTIQ